MAEFGSWRYRLSWPAWKGRYWRARHRIGNRIMDTLARAQGYCNDCPWRAEPGAGYLFWRCALRRHHEGLHRSNNYVWGKDGRPEYVPIPHGNVARPDGTIARLPHQPWRRYGTPTLAQARASRRWHEAQRLERARG